MFRVEDTAVRAYANPAWRSLDVYVYHYDVDSSLTCLVCDFGSGEAKVETLSPRAELRQTVKITPEAAQRLMDDLYNAGIRPTDARPSDTALAATKDHLEDMRAIVAESLGVGLEKSK